MNATVAADAPPSFSMRLLERDWVPDWLIRRGIRKLLAQRLQDENVGNPEGQQKRLMDLIARLPVKSLGSAQLTGEWEARLSRMARDEESRTQPFVSVFAKRALAAGARRGRR